MQFLSDHTEPRASRRRGAQGLAALVLVLATAAPAPDAGAAKAAAKPKPAAAAKGGAPARTGLETLEKQVREFTLGNGLKFIVVGRHDAPVFSFATVVNAGAANDALGTTVVDVQGTAVDFALPFGRARMIDLVADRTGVEVHPTMSLDDRGSIPWRGLIEMLAGWRGTTASSHFLGDRCGLG